MSLFSSTNFCFVLKVFRSFLGFNLEVQIVENGWFRMFNQNLNFLFSITRFKKRPEFRNLIS